MHSKVKQKSQKNLSYLYTFLFHLSTNL